MAKIDLRDEVIELKFKGETHVVTKPTNGQIREYNLSVKGVKEEKQNKLFAEFLEELGLKKEVFDNMTPTQSKTVIQALYDTEKN